ncbi:BatD family protein [Mucilaginibacter myungsuensis]
MASVDKNQVAVGEQFEVAFTLNGNGDRFQPPTLSGLQVLAGPNVSTSMSSINGATSMSIGYSYILAATKEGTATIGSASIAVNGKVLSTKPIRVTVTKGQLGNSNARQQQQQQQNVIVDDNRPMGDVSKSIFLRAAVDKTRAYPGQQLTVSYELYTRVGILESQLDKLPDLNGFWSQDMNDPKQPQNVVWRTKIVNGLKYNVADVKQTILFPQKTGNLTIDPLGMTFIIRQQAPPRDAMEQFFGGAFKDVKVKLKSQPVTIAVKPLPEAGKPIDFTGAVGVFDMKATVDRTALKTSEPLNYNVRISGTGNIMLINNLAPNFPSDFEKYDPKTTDTISKAGGRISGSRFYNFLLIPRHEGKYTLQPLKFSYFNPATEKYVTLTSKAFDLDIAKGKAESNVSTLASSDRVVEKDIRGIKKTESVSKDEGQFFGSTAYNLLLLLGPLAFIGALVFRKVNTKRNSDVVKVRSRKASKIAAKHLKTAKKALAAKDSKVFYEAVFKGIYGYLADKLNIPYANLDKDVISEELKKRSVKVETIAYLEETLDLCDMARFAPVTGTTEEDMFERAKNIIDDIEDEV